jgi:hypothetical protein
MYAHDDVSTGSWFIGLDVKHINEGKFCCSWSSGLTLSLSLSLSLRHTHTQTNLFMHAQSDPTHIQPHDFISKKRETPYDFCTEERETIESN